MCCESKVNTNIIDMVRSLKSYGGLEVWIKQYFLFTVVLQTQQNLLINIETAWQNDWDKQK